MTIVLPCYNPPNGWEENILHNYSQIVSGLSEEVEVIVVNDGSNVPIESASIEKLSTSIPIFQYINNNENNGKGHAVRCGISKANGNYVIYTDIDFPYSTESTIAIYTRLQTNSCDVAVGVKNKAYYDNVPPGRKVISKGLQFFTKTLLSLPISDTQCGLKGFKSEVKALFLRTTINRYLFDIEFLRIAYKRKCRIVPVSVILNENVVFSKMSYKILLPELLNFIKILFK